MPRRSAILREQRAELLDQAQAVNDLCAQESREPNETETTLLADIMGTDGKPGRVDALAKQIEQAERIENMAAELRTQRSGVAPQRADGPDTRHQASDDRTRIYAVPASVRVHGPLRAFRGPVAEAKTRAYAFGQWFLAALHGNERALQYCRDNGIPLVRDSMSEGTNSVGGFTVPDAFEQTIVDLRAEHGVFRREAQVVPMASDTQTQPKRAGGITAYFVNENSDITESDKSWTNVGLTAKKLGALIKYSSELNEDSVVSMADDLAFEIAWAFAKKEDECGFLGDGTSTYGGMTGVKNALQAGSEVTAAAGNTAFSTLDMDDFLKMIGAVQSYAVSGGNAKWFIHRAGWASSMLRLQEAAGGNTTREIAGAVQPLFIGYPVVFVECMNSILTAQISTEGLCFFGDLRLAAVLGSRRGVTIATSADRYFEADQLAIKGTERFAITVHETGDASNSGAIVQLNTPGA